MYDESELELAGDGEALGLTADDLVGAIAELAASQRDTIERLDRAEMLELAAPLSAGRRRELAAQGKALSDGSYPIPDREHLVAAARLAASGHGDVEAARRLIIKRARELGVDPSTLPGFGGHGSSHDGGAHDGAAHFSDDHVRRFTPESYRPRESAARAAGALALSAAEEDELWAELAAGEYDPAADIPPPSAETARAEADAILLRHSKYADPGKLAASVARPAGSSAALSAGDAPSRYRDEAAGYEDSGGLALTGADAAAEAERLTLAANRIIARRADGLGIAVGVGARGDRPGRDSAAFHAMTDVSRPGYGPPPADPGEVERYARMARELRLSGARRGQYAPDAVDVTDELVDDHDFDDVGTHGGAEAHGGDDVGRQIDAVVRRAFGAGQGGMFGLFGGESPQSGSRAGRRPGPAARERGERKARPGHTGSGASIPQIHAGRVGRV